MILLSRRVARRALGVVVALVAFTAAHAAGNEVLSTLKPGHPRLIADAAAWQNAQTRAKSDPLLATFVKVMVDDARDLLAKPPSTYQKTGRRLLGVSREVLRRVLVLSAAYRITGDAEFLKRVEKEMLAVSAFENWNPVHFLDVGEMTAALALGYDWLYADLSPQSRKTIRDAIVAKGLTPALDPMAKHNSWQKGTTNWNQVCFGGMVLGSLAIGDEVPEIAATLLQRARTQTSGGLKSYAPDGVYPEGPGYWSYGTSFSVLTFAALKTALGTDWGLAESPGFLASAGAYVQMNAPSGLYFDYSDCGEGGGVEPTLFWFAQRTGDPGLVSAALKELERRWSAPGHGKAGEGARLMPLAALWWPERHEPVAPKLPLRWFGDGPNPLAVFRSAWLDPKALYLGLKGGSASLSHAHMDAGSFVFELDGVRWARDLGMQDYNSLESKGIDLWNKAQDSQRWTVYRYNNRAHNTLTIDGKLHRVDGDARIVRFSGKPENPAALVDLTAIYAGQAKQVRRGFQVEGSRGVLVQDELSGLKPGADVCWTLVTSAKVDVAANGSSAVLRESERSLQLRVLSPANAQVVTMSAEPPADGYNQSNPDRRLVQVHAKAGADGTVIMAVRLTGDANTANPRVEPLDQWQW